MHEYLALAVSPMEYITDVLVSGDDVFKSKREHSRTAIIGALMEHAGRVMSNPNLSDVPTTTITTTRVESPVNPTLPAEPEETTEKKKKKKKDKESTEPKADAVKPTTPAQTKPSLVSLASTLPGDDAPTEQPPAVTSSSLPSFAVMSLPYPQLFVVKTLVSSLPPEIVAKKALEIVTWFKDGDDTGVDRVCGNVV